MKDYKSLFPIYKNNKNLIYLDSAATSLKPERVINRIHQYLTNEDGSPHRGAHKQSVKATELYEESRETVRKFIGAEFSREIIFTKNATDSLNLLSYGLSEGYFSKEKKKILVTITSHHSNLLTWQRLAKKTGMTLEYLYCNNEGIISDSELNKINKSVALVAFPLISNGLGIIHDLNKITKLAYKNNVLTIVDGSQSVGHQNINVKLQSIDFFIFSGHKIYSPQGIGVLYGKEKHLEKLIPYNLGGDMIEYVTEESFTVAPLPNRLEAGTQNVMSAVGLMESIKFIEEISIEEIKKIEKELISYALVSLASLNYIKILGPVDLEKRGSLITFMVDGIHPHDVASILDYDNIAIRAGHHCCQPLMTYLKSPATCRISVGIYNTKEDIDKLIIGLKKVREVFYPNE